MRQRHTGSKTRSHAGELLLAHPGLRDPNFRRAVVLMSVHNDEGAMGVVLNRPLKKQLGELTLEFASGPLAAVPLYYGGPVEPAQLIIISWQWLELESTFQLQFGLSPDKAMELVGQPGVVLRAYLGYSGWSAGQLEDEMHQDTWFSTGVEMEPMENLDGIALWRSLLGSVDPELRLLADEPDDPTLN